MAAKEFSKLLKDLIQLDVDASHAYQQAIERIDHADIRDQLARFREDHERHVRELSAKLQEMGEAPPEAKPDLKGLLIEGFTAMRCMSGTEGALKAMHSNEKLTNRKYGEARAADAPAEIRALLESNYQDEMLHLSYVEETLKRLSLEK